MPPMDSWSPLDDKEAFEVLGNLTTSYMQKASAVDYLMDFERLTDKDISKSTGISTSTIRHLRRAAIKLAPEIQALLHSKRITFAHAKALASLDKTKQIDAAHKSIGSGWTVRNLQRYISNQDVYPNDDVKKAYLQIADKMAEQIGFPVSIKPAGGNTHKGTIELKFNTLDDFDSLCTLLNINLES